MTFVYNDKNSYGLYQAKERLRTDAAVSPALLRRAWWRHAVEGQV